MKQSVSRRQFLQASAIAGAGLALPKSLLAVEEKIRTHLHQVVGL